MVQRCALYVAHTCLKDTVCNATGLGGQQKCNGACNAGATQVQRCHFRHIKSSFSRIFPADNSDVFARLKWLRPVSVKQPVSFFSRNPRFLNSSRIPPTLTFETSLRRIRAPSLPPPPAGRER